MAKTQTEIKSQIADLSQNKILALHNETFSEKAVPFLSKEFTPLCKLCGKEHWPLQTPCIGKKNSNTKIKTRPIEQPYLPPVIKKALSGNTAVLSTTYAKDIMQNDVIQLSPDNSVLEALTKMQQHNAEYILIAANGALEGIVSKSDIKSAISPYLRPALAKWRQPADDATLQIKLKWIMTRPPRTINPQTPLTAIMENMCRFAVRCLPVVNQQGKLNGLVTSIDVCKALLKLKDKLNTSPPAKIAQNNHRLWSLSASSEDKSEHIIPILDVPASSKEKKLLTVSL